MDRETNRRNTSHVKEEWLKSGFGKKLFGVLCGLSLLPLLLLSSLEYQQAKSSLEEEIYNSLISTARSKEIALLAYLDGKAGRILDFSSDGYIRETMELINSGDRQKDALSEKFLSHLKFKKALDPEIYELFVLDPQGIVAASTDRDIIGVDKSNDPYFTGGKKGVYIKDVYRSNSTGRIGFSTSAPLKSMQTNTSVGVIVARYSLDGINEITTDRDGLGKTGEVYMVNKDQRMITNSRFQKGAPLNLKVETKPVLLYQSQHQRMRGTYRDYRNIDVVGVSEGEHFYTRYGLNWIMLAEIDEKEAFESINELRQYLLSLLAFTVILVLATTIFLTKSIIRPVRQLTGYALEIAKGNYGNRIEIKAKDEIGELAERFQEMSTELQRRMQEQKEYSWIKAGQAELAKAMRGEQGITELSNNILHFVASYLNAQIGSIYFIRPDNSARLLASYAWRNPERVVREYPSGAGLVGESVRGQCLIHLVDIPQDYLKIHSSTGENIPKEILLFPCSYDARVYGVIELGSFHGFTQIQTEFLDSVSESIAIALRVAKLRSKGETEQEE